MHPLIVVHCIMHKVNQRDSMKAIPTAPETKKAGGVKSLYVSSPTIRIFGLCFSILSLNLQKINGVWQVSAVYENNKCRTKYGEMGGGLEEGISR